MSIKLKAKPTFTAKVTIPAPEAALEIEFEFRHKTKDELESFSTGDEAKGRSDVDTVLAVASGWHDVEDEFGAQSLDVLFQNYHSAPRAIVETYMAQLTQVKLGN